MSQGTIMERIEQTIKYRADEKADAQAESFREDLEELLIKHGVDRSEAAWRLAPQMARLYREERSVRLRQEIELGVMQRILGDCPLNDEKRSALGLGLAEGGGAV